MYSLLEFFQPFVVFMKHTSCTIESHSTFHYPGKILSFMYIKECVHTLIIHSLSLTQHSLGDSMEDWVTNFGIQIGFKALTLTKTGFCEISPPSPPGRRNKYQKHIFEHKWAPNYLTMTKLHIRRLDFNTKKSFSSILEFSILKGGKRGKC